MNISEFNNRFDILYNAIASQSAPGLDAFEKSVFLTKAQLEIIKDYYDPLSNKKAKGFENSEKRRADLKNIVIPHTSTTIISSTQGISNNSKFFKIPEDTFLIVYEKAVVSSTDPCLNNKEIKVVPKTHDEYEIQIKNPFKKPSQEFIWRFDLNKINNNKVVELVSPFTLSKYVLRYIKFPNPIILANLNTEFPGEGLTIDGQTIAQTCELHDSIHEEILDRAVELALQAYKPSNLESKIQLDTRNE